MAVINLVNVSMNHLRTDLDTTDPTCPTTDHTNSLMDMFIKTLPSLSVVFVLIIVIFNSIICQLHSPNHKCIQNKLFLQLVMPIVTPFRFGRIQKESDYCHSNITSCVMYVLILIMLTNTCTSNASISDHIDWIMKHMINQVNIVKHQKNVLKIHKILLDRCSKLSIVKTKYTIAVRNVNVAFKIFMIMIILTSKILVQKVTRKNIAQNHICITCQAKIYS